MREQDFNEHPFILTVERMLAIFPKMTEGEKQALEEWEKVNLGSVEKGTTDWPGWTDVYARLSH